MSTMRVTPITWSGRFFRMVFSMLLLLTFTSTANAQDATTKSFFDDPFNHPMTTVYFVTGLLFVTLVLVVVVALKMLQVLNTLADQAEHDRARKAGVEFVPQPSWWDKMWDQLNASVPVAHEQDIDLGHDFDGIRELDNHLPPWWKGVLYGSIVWAVVYMVMYHYTGSLPLSKNEYEQELAIAAEQVRAYQASQPRAEIDVNTLAYTADEALLTNGKRVFTSNNCQQCHRIDGGGNAIGPNLADAYWIHGGSIKSIFLTVKTGVVEKGMPAWGKVMSPTDVRDVAFYVMSLQGTNPPEAKKAQGDLYVPESKPTPADSTTKTN